MGKRGPRPCFDRDEALQRALEVFQNFGYEGATMARLKEAMGGLCAPSVYAAFGSKEAMFREAVERYRREKQPLWGEGQPTAREAIATLLRNAAMLFSSPDGPRGCLVHLSNAYSSPGSEAVQEYLRSCRQEDKERILQRIQRGVIEGDLDPQTDICALASFVLTVLQGLSLQAVDGASQRCMLSTVDCAMAAWDALVGKGER
ncbi:TetR/AcrR family transcriptional regulator [Chitinimonas lacunae]|uniref:TetR/AcrR family transcriptional regulator n=1 Tax=Chitinimonas lacunae TaxID=1963018 RepID=A0ABV8MKU7_9NEIS